MLNQASNYIMNLFILSEDAGISASYYCDKHVVKMIVEVSQMLCTNVRILTGMTEGIPYKSTHANHPCTVWMRTSKENFAWSLRHALALSNEYTARYGKRHKSLDVILWAFGIFSGLTFPKQGQTPFAIAISPESKCRQDPRWDQTNVILSYRLFYVHDKGHFAKWKTVEIPAWFSAILNTNDHNLNFSRNI